MLVKPCYRYKAAATLYLKPIAFSSDNIRSPLALSIVARCRQGDKINIKVTDNFKVKSVRVVIMNPDGSIVDDGYAVTAADGISWEFTAASSNPSLAGDKIIVYASDYPDNLTQSEKTL
jgi:hypothetical protein